MEETTLSNGMRLIFEPMDQVKSVSIGIWLLSGSRFETPEEAGIGHLIEHLMFKGTETMSAREIAEAIDSLGGHVNAFTTKEYTCYYAKTLPEFVEPALRLIADMLLHPKFDPEECERERMVVMEEIRLYEDTPDDVVHDILAKAAWGNHPLGRPVLGTYDTVSEIDRDRIRSFYERYYVPERALVSGAGCFEVKRLVRIFEELFSGWSASSAAAPVDRKKGKKTGERLKASTHVRPQRERITRQKNTEQVHFCLGAEGVALGDEDVYTFQILNEILGGGGSSRLFQRVREERGLAYSIYSYLSSYTDAGLFTIYAGVNPSSFREVLDIIANEMRALNEEGITEKELANAKTLLKSDLLLGLEATSARMSRLGKSGLLLGRVPGIDEVISKIDAVTLDDVNQVTRRVMIPDELTMSVVGPVKDLD
ncbi:MAG TPA: insulinase family protein [Clostridia bacterium]|nr:insulinase family protein [Clostridia bacterium]